MKNKVVLITGSSSGIGFQTALTFARNGWTTYASVKTLEELGTKDLEECAKREKLPIHVVVIDVTNQKQIQEEIEKIIVNEGKIDVLINNAGFGYLGAVEDFTIEEMKEQFDVNLFGGLAITKAILPSMRRNNTGKIITIGSINGLLAFPIYGVYAGTKYAIEAIYEALNYEVKPFNITVSIIEPGIVNTGFLKHAKFPLSYIEKTSVYTGLIEIFLSKAEHLGKSRFKQSINHLTNAEKLARKIYSISISRNPKLRYLWGIDSRLYRFTHRIFPQSIWEFCIRKIYNW